MSKLGLQGVGFNSTVEGMLDAMIHAGYGGMEAGNGVLDVILGAVNPSARFPVTVYNEAYAAQVPPEANFSTTSGVGRTYRYLDTAASPPVFYFGHGLSYCTFAYSKLAVAGGSAGSNVTVAVTVTNTAPGPDGTETVQLYITVPRVTGLPTPRLSLVAFAKVPLAAGEQKELYFSLTQRQISTVVEDGSRRVTPGTYSVSVGGSQPGDPRASANGVVDTFIV